MRVQISYNNKNIIGIIAISYLIFILPIIMINHFVTNRAGSFIVVTISAILSIVYLGFNGKNKYGFSVTKFMLLGLFIKLFIGYIFWQFYIFPDYFSDSKTHFKFNHTEYLGTEVWMRQLADYRITYGYFSFPPDMSMMKHFNIHYFMSNLYLSGTFNPFDISVQNALLSLFSALIIAHIVKLEGGIPRQIKFALLLAIFQPWTMISSIIWRDIVGQFFIAIGGYWVYKASKTNGIYMVFLIIFASLSMYLQRLVYFFYPVITIFGYYLYKRRANYKLLFIPIVIIFVVYFNNSFSISEKLAEGYGSNIYSTNLWLFLPINVIRLILGPLPWTVWFRFDDYTIFLISDYFQSVMDVVLVIFSMIAYGKLRKQMSNYKMILNLFGILFLLFILAGLGAGSIHLAYMATGAIFLIPAISLILTNQSFMKVFLLVFIFYIFINIFGIALGLTGQGLGNTFR